MNKVEKTLCQILEQGESVVLATILSHAGSTPRTAGTKMLVLSDGNIVGTIGGGRVEAEVMKGAEDVFRDGNARIRKFDLTDAETTDSMDVICGGRLEVLTERIDPGQTNLEIYRNLLSSLEKKEKSLLVTMLPGEGQEIERVSHCLITDGETRAGEFVPLPSLWETLMENIRKGKAPVVLTVEGQRFLAEPYFTAGTVYLFGAGHVSQQVAILTRMVDFRTVVLDDREEFANRERFSDADEIRVLTSFDLAFSDSEMDRDSFLVIVTRGHSHDKTVLAQALRTEAGYIGMIGSLRKRDAIYKKLLQEGFTNKDMDRVHSPIGLNIGAETPEEIAVSIVAELVAVRADL
ncbi:XdhC family protein [Desulfococcaceae bacterium HSG8]|nr:XdhC family protein [Desulfococcaceae bacterium HSG8]